MLILIVGTILSLAFWAIDEPYWLLLGSFAGIVEVVPVVGPISAGVLAIGVGLTKSWSVALAAGIVVLIQRQLEDYLIAPRVLGGAVGLSPLLVMVAVLMSGILFGALAVVLAIPAVAVLTTLVDVTVRNVDPARRTSRPFCFLRRKPTASSGPRTRADPARARAGRGRSTRVPLR